MDTTKVAFLPLVLVFAVAVVQSIPIVAAFDTTWLSRLYGVSAEGETMLRLLRHRAVLGLVGAVLFVGLAVPSLRLLAIGLALVSKVSYLLLFAQTSTATPKAAQVAKVDAVTVGLLVVALITTWVIPTVGRDRS